LIHVLALRASSFGADPSLTDESAKTALERAKEKPTSGHREVERILENPEAFREVSASPLADKAFRLLPGSFRQREPFLRCSSSSCVNFNPHQEAEGEAEEDEASDGAKDATGGNLIDDGSRPVAAAPAEGASQPAEGAAQPAEGASQPAATAAEEPETSAPVIKVCFTSRPRLCMICVCSSTHISSLRVTLQRNEPLALDFLREVLPTLVGAFGSSVSVRQDG
jgi:hypothetical protein